MKKTVEIWMDDLGYFSKKECEILKEKISGSYYNINVIYSNYCGNYSIGITSDYDYESCDMTREEFEKEVKTMFTRLIIYALKESYRQ
jgi:hypothetical protein